MRRRNDEWVGTKTSIRSLRILAGLLLFQAWDAAVDDDWALAAVWVIAAVILILLPRSMSRTTVRQNRAEQSARTLLPQG